MNNKGPITAGAEPKGVLITGCSSGIGRAAAVKLAEHGFIVFATVRKESDSKNLRNLNISNLVPISPVDLSNLDHITSVAGIVTDEIRKRGMPGLYALINNAGGGSPSPIELMDLDEFHKELQTRVLGSVAMVQAFLPMIRTANGRIVWIMTPAIIPTPYVAGIHACDFAVNCIVRTLNIETKQWQVPNIMVRCGGIKTPSGLRTTSDVEALLQKGARERVSLYQAALQKWAGEMSKFDSKRTDPEKVSEVILNALTAQHPKRYYSIGYMARAASILEAMPQSVTDWLLRMRF